MSAPAFAEINDICADMCDVPVPTLADICSVTSVKELVAVAGRIYLVGESVMESLRTTAVWDASSCSLVRRC